MSDAGPVFIPAEENIDFVHLQNLALSALKPLNFDIFSNFGNRHGSWEISFSKEEGGLHRFVMLDLTATRPPGHQPQNFDVEVWISAEQGVHFVRRVIRRLTASGDDFKRYSIDKQLQDALISAAGECSKLTHSDLSQTYSRSLLHATQHKTQTP